LLRLRQPLDVFLSHDWPQGIARHGDTNRLLQRKAFLRREVGVEGHGCLLLVVWARARPASSVARCQPSWLAWLLDMR
jgi:hypothetical protein